MKLAVRIFALGVVIAGAAAANSMPKSAPFVSHQAVTTPGGQTPPQCSPGHCGVLGE
jgi:hypothetical protein